MEVLQLQKDIRSMPTPRLGQWLRALHFVSRSEDDVNSYFIFYSYLFFCHSSKYFDFMYIYSIFCIISTKTSTCLVGYWHVLNNTAFRLEFFIHFKYNTIFSLYVGIYAFMLLCCMLCFCFCFCFFSLNKTCIMLKL